MNNSETDIRISVDVTNPGQFYACCGLLELANRLWPGAEGWFESAGPCFFLRSTGCDAVQASELFSAIVHCELSNTMSSDQVGRRDELSGLLKQVRKDMKAAEGDRKKELKDEQQAYEKEKKALDKLWRERPIIFGPPFNLQVDWFLDDFSGGSRFKTWAGQQSVIDITRTMSRSIEQGDWDQHDSTLWLRQPSDEDGVPFNFDSNLGPQASSVDVGYSLDALKVSVQTRPLIELAAFVGLQRFRPCPVDRENLYRYRTWHVPLTVQVASIAACTFLLLPSAIDYEFHLLYRTKYLKSFLPATRIGD